MSKSLFALFVWRWSRICSFKKSEPEIAARLLDEAERRLQAAVGGQRGLPLLGLAESPSDQPQLFVGGFKSRIDDSVQPYGLVVPAGYEPADSSNTASTSGCMVAAIRKRRFRS